MKKKKEYPIGSLMFGVLLTLIGLILSLIKSYPIYQEARSTLSWEKTKGAITRSEITYKGVTGSSGKVGSFAEVSYQYEIDGMKYEASKIYGGAIEKDTGTEKFAKKVTGKYIEGKRVEVYYSPEDSKNAVLEIGLHERHYEIFRFYGYILLAGVILLILFRYKHIRYQAYKLKSRH